MILDSDIGRQNTIHTVWIRTKLERNANPQDTSVKRNNSHTYSLGIIAEKEEDSKIQRMMEFVVRQSLSPGNVRNYTHKLSLNTAGQT